MLPPRRCVAGFVFKVDMPCYSPLQAIQTVDRQVKFFARGSVGKARAAADNVLRELSLPCGQCIGCRLERSRQWAMRCMHEAQLHPVNSFVTLTYSDEFCPISLEYAHFQKFMKRLRKKVNARFFMAGEYGEQFGRPHYHACLFGVFFHDRKYHSRLDSGHNIYTSKYLEELWPMGYSSIGDVTFESAAYVARYITKKVTGPSAENHYRVVDGSTGEVTQRVPEFCHMSLKPGIGAGWIEKYHPQVYPRDEVVVRGRKMRPPKYYDKFCEDKLGFAIDDVQYNRYVRALSVSSENTAVRLRVREVVAKSRLQSRKLT